MDVPRPPDPADSPTVISAASGLVALYAAWGEPEKAAEWRKKLADEEATAADERDRHRSGCESG